MTPNAILVEHDGTRHQVYVQNVETIGVVVRTDTRRPKVMRVFAYFTNTRPRARFAQVLPVFREVDHRDIGGEVNF